MRHQELLETYPGGVGDIDQEKLAACIAACFECAQACTACADACLAEDMVAELRVCIRNNLDCADVCAATGAVLSRQTAGDASVVRTILEACAAACTACGDECAKHGDQHQHCAVCAEACRRCADACRELLADLK